MSTSMTYWRGGAVCPSSWPSSHPIVFAVHPYVIFVVRMASASSGVMVFQTMIGICACRMP
jgi:hypothetical protein